MSVSPIVSEELDPSSKRNYETKALRVIGIGVHARRTSIIRPNMVGVAQLVEHPVVVRDVAGSSPVAHPTSCSW